MQQITEPELLFQSEKIFRTHAEGLSENNIRKGTVVVYANPSAEKLPDAEWNKLLEILRACKLKEEEVGFVNAAKQKVTFSSLRKQFTAENKPATSGSAEERQAASATLNIIIFGDIELSRNLQIKKFHWFEIDGVKILKSEPVSKLLKSEPDRGTLWKQLQTMFNIKSK